MSEEITEQDERALAYYIKDRIAERRLTALKRMMDFVGDAK